MILRGIFQLSLDVAPANLHRVQFVPAHPASENLQPSGDWIEEPFSVLANYRYWKWPVLFAHRKGHPVWIRWILFDSKLLVSRTCKLRSRFFVLNRIPGFENVLAVCPEQLEENGSVVMFGCVNNCLNGFLRSRKRPLAFFRRGLQQCHRNRQPDGHESRQPARGVF